jgi:hypothetical protein
MSELVTVVRSLLHPQTLAFIIPATVCYLAVQFVEGNQHLEQLIAMVKRETAQRLTKGDDQ